MSYGFRSYGGFRGGYRGGYGGGGRYFRDRTGQLRFRDSGKAVVPRQYLRRRPVY